MVNNGKIFQRSSVISYDIKHRSELFHEKSGIPAGESPFELTAFVREKLCGKFSTADVGVTGSKAEKEPDGPEKMFAILLDNGRSHLKAQKEEWQALKCIRCGAYLNACTIYKNVGGYTTTLTGPIGSVLTPFYRGFNESGHLSFAITLCGRFADVCPVKITLQELLLLNPGNKAEEAGDNITWSFEMKASGYTFAKRRRLDRLNVRSKRRMAKLIANFTGEHKDTPHFADQSISKFYTEIYNKSMFVAKRDRSHQNRKS